MTNSKEFNLKVRVPFDGWVILKIEVIPRIPFETRTSFGSQMSQTIDEFLMVPEEKPSDENPKAFFKILQYLMIFLDFFEYLN